MYSFYGETIDQRQKEALKVDKEKRQIILKQVTVHLTATFAITAMEIRK